MLKNLRFQLQGGMLKKSVGWFFVRNDRPAKWRWCQICQHCRKLWWSSYIETAAEMLPKDGSSKVAWSLRPCNVCLFFTWRRATMKIEGFLMVVCCLLLRSAELLWCRCMPMFTYYVIEIPWLDCYAVSIKRIVNSSQSREAVQKMSNSLHPLDPVDLDDNLCN